MGKRGFISANNALFVSVDFIGEKNQVLLELYISLTTFLLLGDFTSKEDWEMRSILSFAFLLISPEVIGFCLTPSAYEKVALKIESIKKNNA